MKALLTQLNNKIKIHNKIELLQALGYHDTTKALIRLDSLLESTSIYTWIKSYGFSFDMKHSARQFIQKTGEYLGIDNEIIETALTEADKRSIALKNLSPCEISIKTDFKRRGQPLFILATLESGRHIDVDKKTKGKLDTWEKIKYYIWHLGSEQTIILPNGKVTTKELLADEI